MICALLAHTPPRRTVRQTVALALLLIAAATAGASPLTLRIIAINDFHGHLEPGDNAIAVPHPADPTRSVPLRSGGAAFVASRVRALRAEVTHSVFVSSGDLIGASPLVSALFRDEPTIEAMNLIGLQLNAVGNHEFDQGVDELRRVAGGGCATTPRGELATCAHPDGRYDGARFPLLAANVVDSSGKTLLAPSWTVAVDGIRVAFIGAVTRVTPSIVRPAGVRGWRFTAEAAAINREAARLRAAGVAAIVALVHEGGEAQGGLNGCDNPQGAIFDIARALDATIDVVLSAHTHRAYNCRIDGRVVIQGASFGRLLSVVDLPLDRESGRVLRAQVRATNVTVPNGLDTQADPVLTAAYPALEPDRAVLALVDHYRERAAPLARKPVGRIAATFDRRASEGGDHALGRLIADAQLAATRDNGARIALTNPGGIRGDLIPHGDDGAVSFGDIFTVQPFGNALVTLTLTGAQLRSLLEMQWNRRSERARFLQPSRGFSYAWSEQRPWGQRIDPGSMRIDGELIDPDRDYRVTVNSFLAMGGDGFITLREGREPIGGPLDVDALADFLRAQSGTRPLAPDSRARIRRIAP
jgi:5'-nucleotidase